MNKQQLFRTMIGLFSEKELMVLYRRIVQSRTLEETGKEFSVTRERVRQIEAKCFEKIHDTEMGICIPSDKLSARLMQFLEDNNVIVR